MKKIILFITFLLTVLGFSFLSPKEVRAAGQLMLDPTTATKNTEDLFPVKIKFQTGGQTISGISARIAYPYTGSTPEVKIVDSSGNSVANNPVIRNPGLDSNWSFPVNSVTATGGIVTLDLSAIYVSTAGYTNNSFEELGTIYLKVNSVPAQNPKILQFDLSQTKMLLKSDSSNILTPPADGTYTIANGPTGTPSPSASPTPTTNLCPWDIVKTGASNGKVDNEDLIKLNSCYDPFGFPSAYCQVANLSHDNVVNALDYSILLTHWGNCP